MLQARAVLPAGGMAAGGGLLREVVLRGSSRQILQGWATAAASLQPGGRILLAPEGGVLEVPAGSPLEITGPIVVDGIAESPPSHGAVAAPGAPEGAVTIRCAEGAWEAVAIR